MKKSSVPHFHGVILRSSSECEENKLGTSNSEWMDKIEKCPVYHPSKEEFDDPFLYLHKIAPEASKYGTNNIENILVLIHGLRM